MSIEIRVGNAHVGDAEKCRRNGWVPGTRLIGVNGAGSTVIEITAVGEEYILAKTISHNGLARTCPDEANWSLAYRDWKRVS